MQDVKSKIEDLKTVAEKLAIEIEVTDLNDREIEIQSGHCKINGKDLIFLDKNSSLQEQSEVILQTLKNFDLENIYVASWIREFIDQEGDK